MVFGRSKSSSPTTPSSTPATSAAAAACSELRAAYHECFNRWYADKFAKGQWQKDDCADHWRKYRACLEEHLEDKHLRQILLNAETSAFYAQLESDPPSGQERRALKATSSGKIFLANKPPFPSTLQNSSLLGSFMAKKTKSHSARGDGAASSSPSSAAAAGGVPWLRLMAVVVLTAHSAFSAYLAREDARLIALVVMGYLLMLALFFYALPTVLQKRD